MTSGRMKANGLTLWVPFCFLPLTYIFSNAEYFLLGGILVLLFYSITSRTIINDFLFLRCGKDNTGIVNLLFYFLFLWFIFVGIVNGFNFNCIVRLIQTLGCFVAFNLGTDSYWNIRTIKNVQKMTRVIVLCAFVVWGVRGFPRSNYSFIFHNPNTFGALMLASLFFSLLGEKDKRNVIVTTVVGIILLYASSTRAALVAFAIYIIVYSLLKKELRIKGKVHVKKWRLYFSIMILVMGIFVVVYPFLLNTKIGLSLNELSRKYTGKNFFSGRQIMWKELLSLIGKNPVVGYGLDVSPGDVTDFNLSAHNSFLQIALQSGLVGLFLVVAILYRIFCNCLLHCDSEFSINVIAIIFAVIFHENFEVTLTQNCLVAGLQTWFLFGLGCYGRNNEVENAN